MIPGTSAASTLSMITLTLVLFFRQGENSIASGFLFLRQCRPLAARVDFGNFVLHRERQMVHVPRFCRFLLRLGTLHCGTENGLLFVFGDIICLGLPAMPLRMFLRPFQLLALDARQTLLVALTCNIGGLHGVILGDNLALGVAVVLHQRNMAGTD